MASDSEYEYKNVKTPQGYIAKEIKKWGNRGWEHVNTQNAPLLFGRAVVTFRRKKG